MTDRPSANTSKGFDYYTQRNLKFYDAFVLGFNNRVVWRCPTKEIEARFDRFATADHCDIGVGTGHFLKVRHGRRPFHNLHLVDANAEAIEWVRSQFPDVKVTFVCRDVSQGIPAHIGPVRSISLNYLLHCMAGPLSDKEPVFASLKNVAPSGTPVFGATIACDDAYQTWLSRLFLRFLNRNGMMDTSGDTKTGLVEMMSRHLRNLKIEMRGSVLMFEGNVVG